MRKKDAVGKEHSILCKFLGMFSHWGWQLAHRYLNYAQYYIIHDISKQMGNRLKENIAACLTKGKYPQYNT